MHAQLKMCNITHIYGLFAEIFRVLKEFGVEEDDGDVRFKSGNGNMAVLYVRNTSGHYYRNSLVIVNLAMGHIPLSTECISSLFLFFIFVYIVWFMFCAINMRRLITSDAVVDISDRL